MTYVTPGLRIADSRRGASKPRFQPRPDANKLQKPCIGAENPMTPHFDDITLVSLTMTCAIASTALLLAILAGAI